MLLSTPPYDPEFIAPNFSLKDVVTGKIVKLYDEELSNGFVICFISNHCPYVQDVISELVSVARSLEAEDIKMFAIMPNNYAYVHLDSPENMKEFAAISNFSFPYLIDETQEVAKSYDAICTPDIFGFNSKKEMRYRGNVKDLQSAMIEISKTGKTTIEQSPSRGCSVKWK